MKKYLLGTIVGIIFVVYSLFLRHQHSEPVIAPIATTTTNATSHRTTTLPVSGSKTTSTASSSTYKDGSYEGSVQSAYYGNVQVAAVILGGKITSVNILQSPNDNPNSIYINGQAIPYLKQETIRAQSAKISVITGATLTSEAFIDSLNSALKRAIEN